MPSKPKRDPAVERFVIRRWKPVSYGDGYAMVLDKRALRSIITEVRRDTARECAEIVGNQLVGMARTITLGKIRERFGLED